MNEVEQHMKLTTGDAAQIANVSADTIRYWERTGRLAATRTRSGIRLFDRDEVERVVRERKAKRDARAA